MIHELRIYTLWPGKVPEFLKAVEEKAIPIRGDNYGKLEGFWFTEIGPLNQVVHLWSHADLNARQERRNALAQNKDWTQGYLPTIMPTIRLQEVRLMHPKLPFKPPATKGNIYEYRHYRTRAGQSAAFAGHLCDIMPVREKYSQNVCLWHTEAGQPNEVSHLWVYKDLAQRTEVRAKVMEDPKWREFLGKGGPLLEEMNSTLLIPAPFSPMG